MRKQHRRISKHNVAVMDHPTAHITLNKSRIKTYPYNQIFMADGSEFQIELDNCTTYVWLAVISVNGEKISDSGLVLKPGEHVFLDTPNIGSGGKKRKFKFETYGIEQGRSHLVANNGKVKIEFYKERTLPPWINFRTYTYISPPDPVPYVPYWDRGFYYSSAGVTSGGMVDTGGSVTISNATENISCSSKQVNEKSCGEVSLGESVKCLVPTEETGRIERGSKSKQKFYKTNYDFETFASYTEEFQIFSLSKRVVNIQEAIREYCTQCGKKRKKNFLFCPKCGNKF